MGLSISYSIKTDQAYIDALVATAISNSTISTQPPDYPSHPNGFQDGQQYRNTTDGFLYVMEGGIFLRVGTIAGIQLQDLSGNTILID